MRHHLWYEGKDSRTIKTAYGKDKIVLSNNEVEIVHSYIDEL